MKKKISILTVLYWACIGCVILGILFAILTFIDYGGLFGAFLAVGTLYPFVILQSAYMVWYCGRQRKNIWNIVAAVTCAAVLFLAIDIAENIMCTIYYRDSYGSLGQMYAGQIIFAILFFLMMVFALVQNRRTAHHDLSR